MNERKYYVIPAPTKMKSDYHSDPTFGFLINLIPAFIWALVITDQALPETWSFWQKFAIGLLFIIAYIVISKIPILTFAPTIASAIMFVGLLWVPVNLIGNDVIRIIVKVIVAIIVGAPELMLSLMVTLRIKAK